MFTESVDISCRPARWLAQRAARGLITGLLCLAACGSDDAEKPSAIQSGAGGKGGAGATTAGTPGRSDAGSVAGAEAGASGTGAGSGGSGGAPRPDGGSGSGGTTSAPTNGDDAGTPPEAGSGGAGGRPALALCSGCPTETLNPMDTAVRVHHVHMNVKSAAETIAFYEKFFAAKPVWLNEAERVLWADPILILLDEVDYELAEPLEMGLEHIGIGIADPVSWFAEKMPQGLMADPRNGAPSMASSIPTIPGISPFMDPEVDTFAYVYVRGPNKERVEVWSGLKRFRHVHFMSPDVDKTVEWYTKLFGISPIVPNAAANLGYGNGITLGNDVQLFYAGQPMLPRYVPTDDRPLAHIAFSVSSLDAAFDKVKSLGLEVVSEPTMTPHGFRSFFLRGPEFALLEYVQAGPITPP